MTLKSGIYQLQWPKLTQPNVQIDSQIVRAGDTIAAIFFDPTGEATNFAWEWLRDGTPIVGATNQQYVVTVDDVGTQLQARGSYTDGQSNPQVVESALTPLVLSELDNEATGTITLDNLTPSQGDTITLAHDIADLDGIDEDGITFQWQRDEGDGFEDIEGAIGTSYTTTQADVDFPLRVSARFTDLRGIVSEILSGETADVLNVNDPPTGEVTISNLGPAENDVLTVSDTIADPDGISPGAITYHWQRDDGVGGWVDIATGSSYTVVSADEGHQLRVDARYTDDHGTAESVQSAPTSAVASPNAPVVGVPTLNNMSPTIDSAPLVANTSGLSDADGIASIRYEWLRRDPVSLDVVAINNSNFATHPMVVWDVGKQMAVRCYVTDTTGRIESATSAWTATVTGEATVAPATYAHLDDAPSEVAPQLYPEHLAPKLMLTETKSRPQNNQDWLRPILGKYDVYGSKAGDWRNIKAHQDANPHAKYHMGFSPRAYQGVITAAHSFYMGFPFETTGNVTQAENRPYTVYAGHWQYMQHTTLSQWIGTGEGLTFTVANGLKLEFKDGGKTFPQPWAVIYDAPLGSFNNAEHVRVRARSGNQITIDNRGYKSVARNHPAGSIIALHGVGQTKNPLMWAWGISTDSPTDGAGRKTQHALARFINLHANRDANGTIRPHVVHGQYSDADPHFISRGKIDVDQDGAVEPSGVDPVTGEAKFGMGLDEFYEALRGYWPNKAVVGGYLGSRGYNWLNGIQIEGFPTQGDVETKTAVGPLVAEYGHDGGNDGFDCLFSIYMVQHLPRPNGQPMYTECLSRAITKTYPLGFPQLAPNSDRDLRLGLGAVLMGDGYWGVENEHDMDPWFDEYAVDSQGVAIRASMDPSKTPAVLQRKGWLGRPLGPHRRIATLQNPESLFAPANTLIPNGTFESNINGWTGIGCNVVRDTSRKVSGNASLRMTSHSNGFKISENAALIASPWLTLPPGQYTLCFAAKADDYRQNRLRMSWISGISDLIVPPTWHRYVFTFRITTHKNGRVEFQLGRETTPINFDEIYLFSGNANVMFREYENGGVWINPTNTTATVDVGTGIYKRLTASGGMKDNSANTGTNLNGSVQIPPYDALIAIKR